MPHEPESSPMAGMTAALMRCLTFEMRVLNSIEKVTIPVTVSNHVRVFVNVGV